MRDGLIVSYVLVVFGRRCRRPVLHPVPTHFKHHSHRGPSISTSSLTHLLFPTASIPTFFFGYKTPRTPTRHLSSFKTDISFKWPQQQEQRLELYEPHQRPPHSEPPHQEDSQHRPIKRSNDNGPEASHPHQYPNPHLNTAHTFPAA